LGQLNLYEKGEESLDEVGEIRAGKDPKARVVG
jgi:hypothetical protein